MRYPVYDMAIFLSYLKKSYKTSFSTTGFFLTDPSISLITLSPTSELKTDWVNSKKELEPLRGTYRGPVGHGIA